jgi:hypothetical protein
MTIYNVKRIEVEVHILRPVAGGTTPADQKRSKGDRDKLHVNIRYIKFRTTEVNGRNLLQGYKKVVKF